MQTTEIIVRGRANVSQKPDSISLLIEVKSKGFDHSTAVKKLNDNVKAVIDGLKTAGVRDEPETTSYEIEEEWENQYDVAKRRFIGFEGNQTLTVLMNLDIEMLGLVLKLLGSQQTKPTIRSTFVVKDHSRLQAEARHKAIEAARSAATDIARQMGMSLQGIKNVEYVMPHNSPTRSLSIEHDDDMVGQAKASFVPVINPQAVASSDDISITWLACAPE